MKIVITLILLFFNVCAIADTVLIGQKNKQFTVKAQGDAAAPDISIKQGDTVRFINEDDFFHNVFSLSDAMMFDLGSFPKGDHRDIVFDTIGEVEVECAIHPEMIFTINVE